MPEIDSLQGPWVLINGRITQEEEACDRRCTVFLRSFLVPQGRRLDFLRYFRQWDIQRQWLPDIPQNYDSFAGEFPWGDNVRDDNVHTWEFEVGREEYSQTRGEQKYFRRGRELDEHEKTILIDKVRQTLKPAFSEAQQLKALRRLFEAERVEARTVTRTVALERPIIDAISVRIPVQSLHFSGEDSVLNPVRTAAVPSKHICDRFGLRLALPLWDTLESNGQLASLSTHWGETWSNDQSMTYLRDDLLRQYLREENLSLIWLVHGERMPTERNMSALWMTGGGEGKAFAYFRKTYTHECETGDESLCRPA